MQIRIDLISGESEIVVRIAGRLSGIAVAQLKQACDPIEGPFMIDLSNLLFADNEGVDAIRAIADKGVHVQGASPFVQLLLNNALKSKTGGEVSKPS